MVKKSIFLILVLFLSRSFSQDTILVSLEERGNCSLPADLIYFKIDLSEEDAKAEIVFENHKTKLYILTKVLNEMQIPDSIIHFSLFKINKSQSRRDQKKLYRTHQKVTLILKEYDEYDQLQIKLIKSGFDNFSASFQSSEVEYGYDLATIDAMNKIRRQIKMLVKELNKKRSKITNINIKRKYNPQGEVFEFFSSSNSQKTLEKIPQKILFEIYIKAEVIIY